MEMVGNPMPERRILGKREMMDLVLVTIRALEEADLEDELQELRARVFARSSKLLFETQVVDDDLWQWRFQPMVELVLHEILSVAQSVELSIGERRHQIRWVLEATGF